MSYEIDGDVAMRLAIARAEQHAKLCYPDEWDENKRDALYYELKRRYYEEYVGES